MIPKITAVLLFNVMVAILPVYALEKAVDSNSSGVIGPASVTVLCDNVLIRIDGPKMWTPSRIEYKGTLLGVEDSAYGTVFKFPEIGFIGTAHFLDRPDGREDVKKLEYFLDDKKLDLPGQNIKGNKFRLCKVSRILECGLDSVVELRNNCIYETTVITTGKQVPLELVYNFMHAWTPIATAVLAHSYDGNELDKTFDDAGRKEYLLKDLEWAAVYDANSCKGAVSYLITKPTVGGADFLIVNAPKVYRKYYVMSFVNQTVPAGFSGTYKMVTGFFEAPLDKWQEAARKVASELSRN